jgi:large subunit ribosomal protein L23
MTVYDVIVRPIVTEKGHNKKESENTLCFEVTPDANKTQIRQAVQHLFKVKVVDVRTVNNVGKLRRRGRFAGYRSDCTGAAGRQAARVLGDLDPCRSNHSDHSLRRGVS